MRFCPECGNELKEDEKICGYCGYDIVNNVKTDKIDETTNPFYISKPPFGMGMGMGMIPPSVQVKRYILDEVANMEIEDEELAYKISNYANGFYGDQTIIVETKTAMKRDLNMIARSLHTEKEDKAKEQKQEKNIEEKEYKEEKTEVGTRVINPDAVAYIDLYEEFKSIVADFVFTQESLTDEEVVEKIQNQINRNMYLYGIEPKMNRIKKDIEAYKKRDLNKIAQIAGKSILSYARFEA